MTPYRFSMAMIRALGPCAAGRDFANVSLPEQGEFTAAEARDAGCTLEDAIWAVKLLAREDAELR